MGGRDLNNRSNTLKTLSTCGTIVGKIENKKLKRLISKNKEGKRGNIWKLIVYSHMTIRHVITRGEIPTTV
jgi:hypothetical protein